MSLTGPLLDSPPSRFRSLVAEIPGLTERPNTKPRRLLLVPLVVAGAASVFYWQRTGKER